MVFIFFTLHQIERLHKTLDMYFAIGNVESLQVLLERISFELLQGEGELNIAKDGYPEPRTKYNPVGARSFRSLKVALERLDFSILSTIRLLHTFKFESWLKFLIAILFCQEHYKSVHSFKHLVQTNQQQS
ncbi:hypothetical protein SELMODRAFT_411770 [Selaginella moellendorffii]|uniref:Uncharacterized protein n=1 Tax=Selaginella moellendorffii TaxID=88036 RepID=D8RIZ8_SELML|nr:hypothetical protein SELMODRAFT_411770 [Selaginella moellendorffii]